MEENMKTLNEKTMTLKLKRRDVCDLLLAATIIANGSKATKWRKIHDTLKQALEEFDKKHGEV